MAPGFGHRGVEGKIAAVKYAREKQLPFFGICLGMQMAVIEFARNVLGLSKAHSTEMDTDTTDPVIDLMDHQKKITAKGGTMRLGSYPCSITPGTLAYSIAGSGLESVMEAQERIYSACLAAEQTLLDQRLFMASGAQYQALLGRAFTVR